MADSNLVEIIVVAFALLGSLLNARAMLCGFYFWIIADILAIYLFYQKELYGMTALYGIYIAICIYGIVYWKKKAS